ncbi:hypothetical protein [Pseudonocardia parietis]|uniref:Uncharacterized protein n=1 Tax=Pseudonocardia parietis TaxID=570936 RepID=A0ABS4VVK8_9PSEU|nr:hypothetical protein [Pseudonocardia parietis]MBP2367954.1 hypothetical protein [Pseudonocardia parietis]
MSAPVPGRPPPPPTPPPPPRPGLVAVPATAQPAPPSAERERLQDNLARVLADLCWPAFRWQVLTEAEAWGVSAVIRNQLLPLPDGRYPSVEAVVEVLSAARGRLRAAPPPPAARPDRVHPAERATVPRPVATPRRATAPRGRPVLVRRAGRRG